MITVKQILEQYNLATDNATANENKLAELSDAGLFESSKLPMIKRSLNKNVNEMTEAEKKTLKYLLESLMTHILVEKNQKVDKTAYPSDKDMPAVIILKRKAIRVFPDNQKIGLYYSQALDRYISIPFGPNAKDLSPQLNEEIINEISQEKAQAAYLERMRRKDASTDPEEKAAHELALSRLTKRMKTREWDKPVKTAKQAYKKEVESKAAADASATKEHPFQSILWNLSANLASKIPGSYDRRMAAKAKPSQATMRMLQLKKSSQSSAATGAPAASTPATTSGAVVPSTPSASVKPGRTIGPGASSKPPPVNRPVRVAESFKDNLRIIREERQYGKTDAALDAASFLPGPAGSAASLASAGMSLSRGNYTGAALDVAGALPGVGYLAKGAKVARAGTKVVSNLPKTSRLSKIAHVIGRGARRVATGLAGAAGAAASALGDKGTFEPTKGDYQFGLKPTVGSPKSITGAESGMDAAAIKRQQQAFGVGVQNESTIYTLKQIVENNVPSHQLQIGEETISINKSIAKKIVKLHESLNRTNKKKLERMLNEDIVSFRKVVNFALK